MKYWEYTTITFYREESSVDIMNEAGREGWEAFYVDLHGAGSKGCIYLKRPLELHLVDQKKHGASGKCEII